MRPTGLFDTVGGWVLRPLCPVHEGWAWEARTLWSYRIERELRPGNSGRSCTSRDPVASSPRRGSQGSGEPGGIEGPGRRQCGRRGQGWNLRGAASPAVSHVPTASSWEESEPPQLRLGA